MSSRFSARTVLVLALMAGCGSEITDSEFLTRSSSFGTTMVSTGTDEYTLKGSGSGLNGKIDFTLTNSTDETISVANCGGAYAFVLEKRVGSRWTEAWSPVLPLCLSLPIEIPPGEAMQDTVGIYAGARGSNVYPQFTVDDITGTYRLVLSSAYWRYDPETSEWGTPVPEESLASDAFELRVQ